MFQIWTTARTCCDTRHSSSRRGVGCKSSPQSLTQVSSWGFAFLPPTCDSNYLGYMDYRFG
ncbi:hypothetical protein D8682_18760 [Buttiauxella sp. 3AFRM03]|nr:hypothetical protein D8682_18760 [Buttiauxella sp. 3AFRM03]